MHIHKSPLHKRTVRSRKKWRNISWITGYSDFILKKLTRTKSKPVSFKLDSPNIPSNADEPCPQHSYTQSSLPVASSEKNY